MNVEIVDGPGVRARLSMRECIEAMSKAMIAVTNGTVATPPRIIMPLIDSSGYFGVMPGSASEPLVYGVKIVSLHPANAAAGRPVLQGFVALFDHHTGTPVALIDGAEITALRTAAASALATRLLARPHARTLGLLGCGVQASSHLEAICAVREIEEVCVWGRSPEKARAFKERHASLIKARIRPVAQAQEAAACDIVCAVTAAHEPVIQGAWVQPGAHVNLVGAHAPTARESDTSLIKKSRLYVDSLASAFSESGDILIPIDEGAINRSHVMGEIGALLLGQIGGRQSAAEITVYKSLGVVAQDLIAAYAVYMKRKQD
jgi:ornithine cyclodeaminase